MRILGRLVPPRGAFVLAACLLASVAASCGGGGGGSGSSLTSSDLASVTPDPVAAAKNSFNGQFAADYLRGSHFDSLVVEIDYAASRPPTPEALDFLKQRLSERCDKPMAVTVVVDEAIPDGEFKKTMTEGDLQAVEDVHRNTYSDLAAKSAALYLLYVKGHSDLDGPQGLVLGLAYRGGSIAYFADNGISMGNPFFLSTDYEAYAITHESGHLLGLVNSGIPMVHNHEDATHVGHDVDPQCLMYWAIQDGPLDPQLGDVDFAQFDAECILDLQAFGGL